MARYRISVALLCGAGFTSLLLLLLKVSSAGIISGILSSLLLPGYLPEVLLNSQRASPPPAVLAANGLMYSAIAFVTILACFRNVNAASMRLATIRLAVPVAILLCLVAIAPLWPRGMTELAKQEKELREALPLGTQLNQAQDVLRSKGIEFTEYKSFEAGVLKLKNQSITAVPGDLMVLASSHTGASQFGCNHEIELILLFGQDSKLKQPYIHRLRLCPKA